MPTVQCVFKIQAHKETTLEVRAKALNSYYAVFNYAVFLIVIM